MNELPPPPVPAEADMRGLPFMPLDVGRLLDSDLFALSTGDEFKAAVALWAKSWTQMPAGSLPNDDRILARLSCAGPRWKKLKSMAMRGFELCSDGRFYHPLIADKVLEAWSMRLRQRERSARGNAKRWGQDSVRDDRDDPRSDAAGDPCGDAAWDRKGQGQGQGTENPSIEEPEALSVRGERTQAKAHVRNDYPADFMKVWNDYPTDPNMSKKEAYAVWKRLPPEERDEALRSLPAFKAYCRQHSDYRPIHLWKYLDKRRSEGFLQSAEKLASASVFVKAGTPQWHAWTAERGSQPPVNRDGGWHFPSLWPPGREPEAEEVAA